MLIDKVERFALETDLTQSLHQSKSTLDVFAESSSSMETNVETPGNEAEEQLSTKIEPSSTTTPAVEPVNAPSSSPSIGEQTALSSDDPPLSSTPIITNASQLDELIITSKGDAPQFKTLEKSLLTLGREMVNDIPLVSTAVSRHHARIEKRNGQWFVMDLGSTNGTYLAKERLAANAEHAWLSGHPLQMGPFTLQWQSPRDLTSGQTIILMPGQLQDLDMADADAPESAAAEDGVVKLAQTEYLNAMLDKAELELALGDSAEIKIGILSQSKIEKLFELVVTGIPDHWITLPSSAVTVVPKKHRSVVIKLDLPNSTMVEAGDYAFEVLLRDMYDKSQVTRMPGKIIVQAKREMSVRMVEGGGENIRPVKMTIKNLGNLQTAYKVKATADDGLRVDGRHWSADLAPGQSVDVDYRVSAESRPLFGQPLQPSYSLTVTDDSGLSKVADGTLKVLPTLPVWMIVAGLVAFVMILLILTLLLR